MNPGRIAVAAACLLGFTGAVLAALGAHAVAGMDDPANYRAWQSAVLLQLVHASVLFTLGVHMTRHPARLLSFASVLLALGVLLFSGSIYFRVALDLEGTFNLAPTGGLLLMLAWLAIGAGLLRR